MKPAIRPEELEWFRAYHLIGGLKKGTKITPEVKFIHAYGREVDDPHPHSVEISIKIEKKWVTHIIKRGAPLLIELAKKL
jgi:hypothetical protein